MLSFFQKLKRVKLNDLKGIWKLPISLVCAPFFRLKHRDLWIVCEDRNEARDNGYWFYKYVRTEHPEQECIYAISSKSPDIRKIKELGEWVEFGSLKHWIMYLAASKKISSQKAGNPNAAVFYFLEVYGLIKDIRIFLQHGIIKDDLQWLYYSETKFIRFICGAFPEYNFVKERFGYPDDNVAYTGLCRFDGLHNNTNSSERIVLIMPTWREWIADEDERLLKYEGTTNIAETNYFKKWKAFLTDSKLEDLAERYGCKFIFFPHRNMQKYMRFFPESTDYVEIADANKYDVQELIKMASMMVTDYSSVFFDMIYMKKPVAFYQFDYEKFRRAQYQEGYFNYRDNPFGESVRKQEELFSIIEGYIKKDFSVDQEFLDGHSFFFKLYDTENCARVYSIVKAM